MVLCDSLKPQQAGKLKHDNIKGQNQQIRFIFPVERRTNPCFADPSVYKGALFREIFHKHKTNALLTSGHAQFAVDGSKTCQLLIPNLSGKRAGEVNTRINPIYPSYCDLRRQYSWLRPK